MIFDHGGILGRVFQKSNVKKTIDAILAYIFQKCILNIICQLAFLKNRLIVVFFQINKALITVNRGDFAQSLNSKYFYKSHCKSCELLWAFQGYHII